jgi:hypothetical protein
VRRESGKPMRGDSNLPEGIAWSDYGLSRASLLSLYFHILLRPSLQVSSLHMILDSGLIIKTRFEGETQFLNLHEKSKLG